MFTILNFYREKMEEIPKSADVIIVGAGLAGATPTSTSSFWRPPHELEVEHVDKRLRSLTILLKRSTVGANGFSDLISDFYNL